MKSRIVLAVLIAPALFLCSSAVFGQTTAHADIVNAAGQKIGTAAFSQIDGAVQISVDARQLPPGTHGIHIHAVGRCEGPDFKTAGGHFNPANKKHGKDNPDGPHNGDLLNITAGTDGRATASLLATNVTLGEGANSLFQPGGTAIVIHAGADDYRTDPAGNSGARIACGVIQKDIQK
jgi:superoxide dismutase, Cu-Zn family